MLWNVGRKRRSNPQFQAACAYPDTVTSHPQGAPWQRPGEIPKPGPARPGPARVVDPEDDLTPVGYPGDFGATSVLPYQVPGSAGGASPYHHLLDHQEPLPYVQPGTTPPAAEPVEIDAAGDNGRVLGKRGTQHLGLLILRAGLGAVLCAHGLQKLTGWLGGQGVNGLKDSLSDAGYHHADLLAYLNAGGELVAGALLVLGLFTPVAAAGALALLVNGLLATVSAKQHHGLAFFGPGGLEYQVILIVLAAGVTLAGPGRYGFDASRRWAHRPFIGSFVLLIAGIAAGVAVWALLRGINPFAR